MYICAFTLQLFKKMHKKQLPTLLAQHWRNKTVQNNNYRTGLGHTHGHFTWCVFMNNTSVKNPVHRYMQIRRELYLNHFVQFCMATTPTQAHNIWKNYKYDICRKNKVGTDKHSNETTTPFFHRFKTESKSGLC